MTPLLHGAEYFAALLDALAASEAYVFIVAWCLSPDLPLLRGDREEMVASRLATVLARVARRVPVRILLWCGAPVLYQPSTRYVRRVQARFAAVPGDLQCRLDRHAPFTHTHHQKAIVVDGRIAFVGGMDLTTLGGDRWDTAAHKLRAGRSWHDVQVAIEGEAVADVEANFRQRWAAVAGNAALPSRPPLIDPTWHTPVQILRTIPRRQYGFARDGEFGISHAYLTAIANARRFIYLENQYLWSPTIMAALGEALARPREEPFRVVVLLPAKAGDGKWDNDKHVTALRKLDRGHGRVEIYTPYTSGPRGGSDAFAYRPIYVHAKVAIVDDEWFIAGSANLNTRGLTTDGELDALVADPPLARAVRVALWAEHLRLPEAEVAAADPITLIDQVWPAQAAANARILRARDRPLRTPILRYEVGRMPGTLLLEDLQSLTFEH